MILESLCRFIPYRVKIKSLYWVLKEAEINSELEVLFSKIDNDCFNEAFLILENMQSKWIGFKPNPPDWFRKDYIGQLTKAETMLYFLTSDE